MKTKALLLSLVLAICTMSVFAVSVVMDTTESATISRTEAPATPTTATVVVNGSPVQFDAYTIAGNNYFKLRDLAFLLNKDYKGFNVTWDETHNAIYLTSQTAYEPVGGEMVVGMAEAQTAYPTDAMVFVDNKLETFTAYEIGDNNYFKLRDICETFDIGVTWDGETQTIYVDTSQPYEAS